MFIILPIIFEFFVFIGVIILIISKIAKHKKNDSNSKIFKNTISNANDPNSYANSKSSESVEVTCDYCGAKYHKIKRKCPSCGARNNK